MDLSKQTNDQLNALCKQNGIKGYSKLKKDDKIAKLVEAGVSNTSEPVAKKAAKSKKSETKEVKEKKTAKPRVEKLDKKLAKAIDLEKYNDQLADYKEDITIAEILELLKSDIEVFVNEADEKECAELVDKYGALTALVYQRANKNSKLSLLNGEAEVYKILLLHLIMTNEKVSEALVKSVKKFHAKLLKPAVEKKPKKADSKKVTKVKGPEDDDDEDEVVDEDDDEVASIEEPNYSDSDIE